MYAYSILRISEADRWIYIECKDEDSVMEHAPFVALVKHIAKKWNSNVWEGNIAPAGEMRYRVKNDPMELVYQWDDLFGIVLEYGKASLEETKKFILEHYGIQ